ncbi:hypothetical protein ABZZ80_09790, partial [Streptomyces sp. NPDC006356]
TEWHARRPGVRPTVAIRVNPLPADYFFSERSRLGSTPHEGVRAAGAGGGLTALGPGRPPRPPALQMHPRRAIRRTRRADGRPPAAFATAHGTRSRVLNLGGGLEARDMLERAGSSCEHFADAAHDALRTVPRGYRLLLEPGRFVFADAAIVLTDVISACHKDGRC